VTEWLISAWLAVCVGYCAALDSGVTDMTIPTVCSTYWHDTLPTPLLAVCVEELQGLHDTDMTDYLSVQWSEIPSPTGPVLMTYDALSGDRPSMLERLIVWMLGPKP
jgi:hypothetical protein